ncbi:putative acetyltransferase [Sulfolobales Beppu rod-shaped virus 1]|uniref:Putative acetyltransferase n=1 Tax=Sulfolobales Beppu rod-shaped virus 1 TaxID=2493121 RepID=A0A3Q8Q7B2_9VIRU|nr:putative acetyltransferase [Sulfolobales Beppu rod-shaped virus 1]AZI75922.1 putative acetyltransferase [Sulfolobales Beppu rod-shaped virus 1]
MPNNCKVVQIEDKRDIKLVRLLIDKYHQQGLKLGGGASKVEQYYAYECEGFIVAVAWLHGSEPYRFIAQKFNIPLDRSLFIRRITKTSPEDYLISFLNELSLLLRQNGYEALWTLGFPNHSNALYKKANFEEVGETNRTKNPVFVRWLNEHKSER